MRSMRKLGMPLTIATLLFIVVASPLLMLAVSQFHADWSKLSNVGQSYGFISATFSALAFIALAWSIRQQVGEAREQREEAAREMQTQILSLALSDPYLLACYASTPEELGEKKRFYYLNLLFWWWHQLYSSNRMPNVQLRFELAQLLRGEAGREYVQKQLEFQRSMGNPLSTGFFGAGSAG